MILKLLDALFRNSNISTPPVNTLVNSCVIVAYVDIAKLVVVNKLVAVVQVKPVLVVVAPSPLPIISCPAVLLMIACFASNAPCDPDVLLIANDGICESFHTLVVVKYILFVTLFN